MQQNWKVENETSWGSFRWAVIRSEEKDSEGYYWYYVYFSSNAYFNKIVDGKYVKAIAYVEDITLTMYSYKDEYMYQIDVPYAVCEHYPEIDPLLYVAYFYAKTKYGVFKLKYSDSSAYLESKYN